MKKGRKNVLPLIQFDVKHVIVGQTLCVELAKQTVWWPGFMLATEDQKSALKFVQFAWAKFQNKKSSPKFWEFRFFQSQKYVIISVLLYGIFFRTWEVSWNFVILTGRKNHWKKRKEMLQKETSESLRELVTGQLAIDGIPANYR